MSDERYAPLLVVCALACALSLPADAALVELKHYDDELAKQGVGTEYSDEGLAKLIELVRREQSGLEEQAAAAPDDKKLRRMADAVDEALVAATAIHASSDEAAKAATFPALKSLLYSIRSELQGKRKSGMIAAAFGVVRNLSLKLPYVASGERGRPLSLDEARLEAVNLVDPQTGKTYTRAEELVGLSSDQVSRLEVRDDNYLWYTDAELERLKTRRASAWRALESRLEDRTSSAIKTKYELDEARRILVFDGVKTTGTSPKIEAEDLHDQKWSVKWGEEVQAEVLGTRLYVELGGKFADLVYANTGAPDEFVLVLNETDEQDEDGTCSKVATFESFATCLRESNYKFDVSAHVVSHGVIDEDTLRREPFSSRKGDLSKLVGRQYVTFNESLVAFEPSGDEFLRLGGAPLSSGGALDDRVKRGLVVLTYWTHNKDAKDHNNHGVIDRESAAYLEYMHDLGASLGSLKISGNPNLLNVGDRFLEQREDSVRYGEKMLYLPRAFKRATFADAVWMARKIAGLSRDTILDCIARTNWPDFQQQIMASRMIARRNLIARVYGVGEPMSYDAQPMIVSLRTPDERLDVVRRYHLSLVTGADEQRAVALLEQFMRESGIDFDSDRADFEDQTSLWAEDAHGGPEQRVLATNECRKSVLVALLERTVHPSGLSRRVQRRTDDKPLPPCQPTKRSLDLGAR
jgi:hypothetical protein